MNGSSALCSLLASAAIVCASCGLEPPSTPAGGLVITIQSFSFSPADITVDPGGVIVVRNVDPEPHSVTSESAEGAFSPGGVNGVSFDTGAFASGDRTITIPTTAPHGTVVPYYCSVHTSGMPQGRITIR
ncbi:MAG: cupredoxin domain-containing protein [Polyangiales bacterium]